MIPQFIIICNKQARVWFQKLSLNKGSETLDSDSSFFGAYADCDVYTTNLALLWSNNWHGLHSTTCIILFSSNYTFSIDCLAVDKNICPLVWMPIQTFRFFSCHWWIPALINHFFAWPNFRDCFNSPWNVANFRRTSTPLGTPIFPTSAS